MGHCMWVWWSILHKQILQKITRISLKSVYVDIFGKMMRTFLFFSLILAQALHVTARRRNHFHWPEKIDVTALIITCVSIAVFLCCVLPLCWKYCGKGQKFEYRRPVVYDTHCDEC